MGTEIFAKKIDLVVMTGSVPFITAGVFQEDDTDATLISGALSGMSNMFQELLKQGELRHSELYNAHVYIRHLTQMNDSIDLIGPEIKHGAQMRVAIIVREGELTGEQELALSELCYSIMVKICERTKLAKILVKGNVAGYIPTSQETIEILAEAIIDYRKRARKSIFYEKTNFLQEKDRFSILPMNESLLESQITDYSHWVEESYYPEFFPKIPFEKFFGKKEFWKTIQKMKSTFKQDIKKKSFKEQVTTSLLGYVLRAGLMPLILYPRDILKRINSFFENELQAVFNSFLDNILYLRGPVGICLQAINSNLVNLRVDDERKIGWHFLRNYLLEIGNQPFELPILKQFCKILEQFDLKEPLLKTISKSKGVVVPKDYYGDLVGIINAHLKKPVDLNELLVEKVVAKSPKVKSAPGIPQTAMIKTDNKKPKEKKVDKNSKETITLPKARPESTAVKNQSIIRAISTTFSWAHQYLFGNISLLKKNLPSLSNEGLLFYNISESLTIEMGLIFDLIQAFSGPRTWLIGQLGREIDVLEESLKAFDPDSGEKFKVEKKRSIDVQHVNEAFRKIADRIISIITQMETDAAKGKMTKENKKSYLEAGFLGRAQEVSIPQTRKLIDELSTINKQLSVKELELISKATSVNFKGLTTNVTSLQLLAIPLPSKESEYSKGSREIISCFKKWNLKLEEAINTIFRVGIEYPNPKIASIHNSILEKFLRANLSDSINENLDRIIESKKERRKLVDSSFYFKNELFSFVGDRLLDNKPLKLFTAISLTKHEDEKNYLFNFSPLKPPIVTEEISRFFVVTEGEIPEVFGRIYTYQPFENEEINNLTELIISDAFRRAYLSIETGITKMMKIGNKIHGGIPNLLGLLFQTYHQICSKLSISKTTN